MNAEIIKSRWNTTNSATLKRDKMKNFIQGKIKKVSQKIFGNTIIIEMFFMIVLPVIVLIILLYFLIDGVLWAVLHWF